MLIKDEYFVTIALDIVTVQILLGISLIPKYGKKKGDTGQQIFAGMGICIVTGAVFDLICRILAGNTYGWGRPVIFISRTIAEIAILVFLFFLLLYADYSLFSSRYHLKRHFGPYLIPLGIFALAYIINLFTGILFTVSGDLNVIQTKLYYMLNLIEYVYLILPVIHFLLGLAKTNGSNFLHPFSIYVPMIIGEIVTIFTPVSAVYLGCSIGLTFLIFSGIDEGRFKDKKTSFYNSAYLKYVLNRVEEKSESISSMILFEIKGNINEFTQILKESLPAKSEILSLPDRRFLFLSDNASTREIKVLTSLVLENASDYDAQAPEEPIEAKGTYRIFKNPEDVKNGLNEMIALSSGKRIKNK